MDSRTERMLAERQAAQDALAAMPRGQRLRTQTVAFVARHRRVLMAAVAGLLAVVLGRYVLVTWPARANERRLAELKETSRLKAEERLNRGEQLDACLAQARAAYVTDWDASCRALRRRESCTLPEAPAQAHEARLLQMRGDCLKH